MVRGEYFLMALRIKPTGILVLFVVLITLLLGGCTDKQSADYKKGYEDGEMAGYEWCFNTLSANDEETYTYKDLQQAYSRGWNEAIETVSKGGGEATDYYGKYGSYIKNKE